VGEKIEQVKVVSVAQRATSLLAALEELRSRCHEAEHEFRASLAKVRPTQHAGAVNLVHYVALRRHDLRALQAGLAQLGLSSLGRSEPHVLASVERVIGVLQKLVGLETSLSDFPAVEDHEAILERNAERLLGPLKSDRTTRVMVTLPSEAATHSNLVADLVDAGMDLARINCAHDGPDAWRAMADEVRGAASTRGSACRIAMDLAGPKLRTGPMPLGPRVVKVSPVRDQRGTVIVPARFFLRDEPTVSPSQDSANEVPVLPPGALRGCRLGDAVRLRDSRGAHRRLLVVDVRSDGVMVECRHTVYLESGLALNGATLGSADATIGELPRRETALILHVDDMIVLTRGDHLADAIIGGPVRISCTLPGMLDDAQVGHRVWFDDGKIGAVVTSKAPDELRVRVIDAPPGGARLRGGKGINLPDTDLAIPAMTSQDEADLATAVDIADIINVSFVRTAADVELVQQRLDNLGASSLGIVLKIETVSAFEHLPEILLAAMCSERIGVMIARGDLAVEAGYERMAEVQEEILWLCEAGYVPVIWATQVLDQLARTGRPSRAEVTDAASAGRAECIMLNKGPHIVTAITTLIDINRRMQDHQHKKQSLLRRLRSWDRGHNDPSGPRQPLAAHASSFDDRLTALARDLTVRFPDCTLPIANELVRNVAAQFEAAPIQDFVPVLTNHICQDRLQQAKRYKEFPNQPTATQASPVATV
jgi:pyruvate kinase